jgi:hypothetical protein
MPKGATGGLLLAGIAAFAYYKYSKMSQEEKDNLMSGIKEKGQKLYDQYMPAEIKDMFGKKANSNTDNSFDEASVYSS